ncbi:MAG: alpha/beta hydrolase [Deltaproteobacteria bacterium]|nr:alpha/beta hydrolase [Deltaproteobacteria bacterium]
MTHYREGEVPGIDGTRIHYSVLTPDGPNEADLVLCDGIGCDGFVWKYLTPSLAPRHRIVRWHYRGHGRSGTPLDLTRMGIEEIVGDLASVLVAAEIEKAVLIGHSVGVQVILEAWRTLEEKIAGLIPVCGSYGRPLDTFHDTVHLKRAFPVVYRAMSGLPELALRAWRVLLPSRAAWVIALMAGEVNRSLIRIEDMQPYFDHLSRMDPKVFVSMLSKVSEHSARDLLPAIDVPTLVIAAELDTFTPAWLSEEMADAIPDAELLMVPKGSHVAPIEQPDLFELRIEKFLREKLGCYSGS